MTLSGFGNIGEIDSDIQIPTTTTARPSKSTYTAENPIAESDTYEVFKDMQRFLHREKHSKVKETWGNYSNLPISRLSRKEEVLRNLFPGGRDPHPDSDFQFRFHHAPSRETRDLRHKTYIHDGDEVIFGSVDGDTTLPMKAQVEHVADDGVYISPKPERNFHESELEHLFTESGSFHIVQLLNAVPYDRKKSAIDAAKRDEDTIELVSGRKPLVEYPRSIGEIYAQDLNEYQKKAAGRALGTNDVCYIQGPPGTGKSRTLTAIIKLAIARGDRVLACTDSNTAIDNLLIGESSEGDIDESSLHAYEQEVSEVTISRIGSRSDSDIVKENYTGIDPAEADLVAGTTSAAATLNVNPFDLVVVDEATQADQPSTLIPFLQGDRVVLAGDQKQLPPFCANDSSKEEEIHISLFEHLLNVYGEHIATQLSKQYRMNEAIASFPNKQFYDDALEHGEENRTWTVDGLDPVVGYDVSNNEGVKEETGSKYNRGEAGLIATEVVQLIDNGVSPSDIGVITPYNAQITKIDNALSDAGVGDAESVEINTIDSFQGSEKEVILVSFVRSNDWHGTGFLTKPDEGERRLNVSLTRAKKRIVIVGDFDTLGTVADGTDPEGSCAYVYQDLRDHLEEMGALKN
ncbi:AAA domain-containing protein [Natrinema sp. 1APR25-10V2]|uniref:AAA domain-containing protein n=1 Tax=Natrinema sp. 1APR25-10V2 TaxID=2951081 RepID=UPI002875CBB1|nr:AAA domain-containing protein [Natrinema sp. 1APR25-10V2]MDS0478295.1 DEAD/DEAH box helicase family protein [Natrinema sp. 1APR25-10V2]